MNELGVRDDDQTLSENIQDNINEIDQININRSSF